MKTTGKDFAEVHHSTRCAFRVDEECLMRYFGDHVNRQLS